MHRNKHIFTEIIGLPGAGKSSLLQKLIIERTDFPPPLVPVKVKSSALVQKLLKLILRMAFRSPLALFRLVLNKGGRWLLLKVAHRWAGLDMRPHGGLLLDSGLLQPLVSCAAEYSLKPIKIDDKLALLSILSMPRSIIYLDPGIDVALARYYLREQLTGQRPGTEVSSLSFSHAQEVCNRIIKMFPPEQVTRINSNDKISAKMLDEVVVKLDCLVSESER